MKQKSKNYVILGLLLFGITLLLWNCTLEEDVLEPEKMDFNNVKTVSFKDAIALFISKSEKIKKRNAYARNTEDVLEIDPDWNTLEHNEIAYTNAQLTTANSEINRNGEYSSELYFINVNNYIRNVVFTIWKDEIDSEGNVMNGRVFFNDLEGKFIDGYIIENGIFTKRYVIQPQAQQASFLSLFFFQSISTEGDCWNTDTLGEFDGGVLEEVIITGNPGGESNNDDTNGPGHSDSYNWYYSSGPGGSGYSGYINGATTSIGLPTGVGSLSSGQISSAAAAILIASPVNPDEDGNCPEGYVFNPTTEQCDPICTTGGKVYNTSTETCECPEGTVEDREGNCVAKPCEGDPVRNPEIVSSGTSGKKGGTFGCTRKQSNKICAGIRGDKKHNGLDINAPINQNAFAMYSGTISSIRNTFSPGQYKKDSYGNYVIITTIVDGNTYNIKYNHLNTVSVSAGQPISAGDIIGLTGNTGNANPPKSKVTPHIHLQVYNSNWSQSLDPADFLNTKFDSNYNTINYDCQ